VFRLFCQAAQGGAGLGQIPGDVSAEPTPYFQLADKASEQLMAVAWRGREYTYRELIALQEQTGKPGQTTKPFMDLSRLFYLLGRWEEACACAQAATESARGSDISTLLAMAADNQAACSMPQGKPEQGLAAAEEALRVIDPGKMGDLIVTSAPPRPPPKIGKEMVSAT
jgi:hypothetical protein